MTGGFWLGDGPEFPLTREQFIADLAGKDEILRDLDIGDARYRKWQERRDRINCPRPLRIIGGTRIYSLAEWRTWYGNWITRHDPDKGWRNTKHHGEGESFFTYWR